MPTKQQLTDELRAKDPDMRVYKLKYIARDMGIDKLLEIRDNNYTAQDVDDIFKSISNLNIPPKTPAASSGGNTTDLQDMLAKSEVERKNLAEKLAQLTYMYEELNTKVNKLEAKLSQTNNEEQPAEILSSTTQRKNKQPIAISETSSNHSRAPRAVTPTPTPSLISDDPVELIETYQANNKTRYRFYCHVCKSEFNQKNKHIATSKHQNKL